MFGYGLAYALASLSCAVGPFLAVIGQTFRSDSPSTGVLAFIAYGAGMTLAGALAVAVALAGSAAATTARRLLPHINRVAGGLMVLAGGYIVYCGVYELRLFFGSGDADDPVITAASTVQRWASATVDSIGALPLIGVLIAIVLAAVALQKVLAKSDA